MIDVPAGSFFLGETIDGEHKRTRQPVLLKANDLTTHGVIVGMTGSGKTGLGLVLIEEALLQGVPVLMIDPKGDVGNLLLTFPDLAPGDFARGSRAAMPHRSPPRGGTGWPPGGSTAPASAP